MNSRYNDDSFPDLEWDAIYFALILELGEKNASRYEKQSEQILQEKTLTFEIGGVPVIYTLNRTGCWFETNNPVDRFQLKSWIRFGLGKSVKRRALPGFFAKTEADLMFSCES